MHLGVIDTPTLGRHADALASRRPSPQELFQRWDTQQWKIADIELEKDIPPGENNPNKQYRQTQATGRQGRASRPSIACTTQARPRRRGVSRSTRQGHLKNCLAGVFGLRWVRLGLHPTHTHPAQHPLNASPLRLLTHSQHLEHLQISPSPR